MEFFAILLKPFFALALFLAAYLVSRIVWKLMPDGPLRRRLFSPLRKR